MGRDELARDVPGSVWVLAQNHQEVRGPFGALPIWRAGTAAEPAEGMGKIAADVDGRRLGCHVMQNGDVASEHLVVAAHRRGPLAARRWHRRCSTGRVRPGPGSAAAERARPAPGAPLTRRTGPARAA